MFICNNNSRGYCERVLSASLFKSTWEPSLLTPQFIDRTFDKHFYFPCCKGNMFLLSMLFSVEEGSMTPRKDLDKSLSGEQK